MKQKLLLLAAVFFGLLAFMFTYQQIQQKIREIDASTVEVYIVRAARDLTEGTKITEKDIIRDTVKRNRNEFGSDEIRWQDAGRLLGQEVILPVAAGRVMQWSFMKPNRPGGARGGLHSFIRPGFRAISISVDSVSSVTGLVQPDNYVDLVGTFRFPDTRGDATLDTITLTILQRVRVLATGTDMGMQSGAGVRGGSGSGGYSTVTLELTPKEVEMIIFAHQKGRLTLSLRSYEDAQFTNKLQSVDWQQMQNNIQQYNEERERDMRNR